MKNMTLALPLVLLLGCGGAEKKTHIKGKLTHGSVNLKLAAEEDSIEVLFLYTDRDGKEGRVSASVGKEGLFDVDLPPNTDMRVAVRYGTYDTKAEDDDDDEEKQHPFWRAFNENNTPLQFKTAAGSTQEIHIDLKAQKVTSS